MAADGGDGSQVAGSPGDPTAAGELADSTAVDGTLGTAAEFDALLHHVRDTRGFDFTGYKRASLVRRVERRMQQVNSRGYVEYLERLELDTEEFTSLFDTMLINVTSFFRDPAAWDYLRAEVLPTLLAGRSADSPLRIWSAGCASGEEAYTLAMSVAEAMGLDYTRDRVKVYATDVDEDALAQARLATYDDEAVANLPEGFREKYFDRVLDGQRWSFRKDLRRSVIFGRNDLVQNAPISHIDLLVCRNALMYLNAETQSRVLARFHFALNPTGYLFLGKAEMLLSHTALFTPVSLKQRIFRPLRGPAELDPGRRDAGVPVAPVVTERYELLAEALSAGGTAQLVVDQDDIVLLLNGRAQAMFDMLPTDIGRPLRDFGVSYRPADLRSLIDQVNASRRPAELREIEWQRGSGEPVWLDVTVTPLFGAGGRQLGSSVSIADVTSYRRLREGYELASRQVETAYEELQSTNEELETTNEELQSTVEELETTNEELQSTNEELETMNEELQSTNDELQVINETLHERTSELDAVQQFLDNVLGNLRSAVFSVDRDLRVQVWNAQAEELWGLRAEEVQHQHLADLDIGLPTEELRPVVRSVARGEQVSAELTLSAVNRRGRHITVQLIVRGLGTGDPSGAATAAGGAGSAPGAGGSSGGAGALVLMEVVQESGERIPV